MGLWCILWIYSRNLQFCSGHFILWRRKWQPTPVPLPGKSHGRRRLVGYSSWGREESDRTERLHFYFSLACIEEGNGNPLQCSCLENSRDGGAWWAAVYGVAQSRTRLKRLSRSSSSSISSYKQTHKQKVFKYFISHNSIILYSFSSCLNSKQNFLNVSSFEK